MEMRRLEAFCKVVELKSFTRAAESLTLSQPTVSEHIRGLEDSLGERLIDRLGREVKPTPVGRIFYQYARNILQLKEEAVQALDQFKGKLSGRLLIGASTIPGAYILPLVIGSFKAAHPEIQITLRIADSAQIAEEVLDGGLEAGFIGAKWVDKRIVSESYVEDELTLAVYRGHRWAEAESVDLAELGSEQFIMRERGSGTRSVMSRIFEEHGFDVSSLHVVAEMGSSEAVRQGIKAKIGISILSRQAISEDILNGSLIPVAFRNVHFTRPIYVIQRRNRQISPLCMAFLEYVRRP